jgi:hypothetical protein
MKMSDFVLRAVDVDGAALFYTGRAGDAWLSPHTGEALRYDLRSVARRQAERFNAGTTTNGCWFTVIALLSIECGKRLQDLQARYFGAGPELAEQEWHELRELVNETRAEQDGGTSAPRPAAGLARGGHSKSEIQDDGAAACRLVELARRPHRSMLASDRADIDEDFLQVGAARQISRVISRR